MPPLSRSSMLQAAIDALRAGGLVACPTEAVWGLSCDPHNPAAVARLLQLKQRPRDKGLILVAASETQCEDLLRELTPAQRRRLAASWPGPTTWLLPHGGRVPDWVTGAHDTVALRVSDHPLVADLCRAFGGPLVSTSANHAGAAPALTARRVREYFGAEVDAIIPGELGGSGRPTQIRDLASGEIIRP